MRWMSQPVVGLPDVTRHAIAAARALTVGLRAWSLYPSEHPALALAVDRLVTLSADVTRDGPLLLAITPQTLVVAGAPLDAADPVVAECARKLHDVDLLQLSFVAPAPDDAIRRLLATLTLEQTERRQRGGPASIWSENGHPAIFLEQIDYQELLERETDPGPARRDHLWQSIVRSIIAGRRTFTEAEQRRLIEIAHDVFAVGELADDCRQAYCSSDGSPLLTTQAATVLAVYRHLAATVGVLEPEHTADVMNNFALATSSLEPALALEVLQMQDADDEVKPITAALKRAFDEQQVALLLARALARAGGATHRLSQMLDTLAPDEERRQRVLKMADKLLSERDFGATRPLTDIRASLEELLLKYDETPYVSGAYRRSMDGATDRAADLSVRDLPPELPEWLETLGHENVRELSGQLLVDLFNLETDPARAAELAGDVSTFAQELLMAGAYTEATRMVSSLRAAVRKPNPVAADAVRAALERLGHSQALIETIGVLGEIDAADASVVRELCGHIGAACVPTLLTAFGREDGGPQAERAAAILISLGPDAITEIGSGIESRKWWVQRVLAQVLGHIGTAAAVPPLQVLLRKSDARVLPAVLKALSGIDDPAAGRAVHTVLRAVTGKARDTVVETLIGMRDSRAVPILGRILDESDVLGRDFDLVLQSLDAIASFKDDRAVRPISAVAQKRKWLAPGRTRRMRECAVAALTTIGSTAARKAVDTMRADGDWHLRRVVRRAAGVNA